MALPEIPDLVRVRRESERASYVEADVAAILDAGFVCHVATVRAGRPVVLPTLYARDGGYLLLHGSPAAGMFRDLRNGSPVCVTVTHVDGLVLARSVFNHSANYRSVTVHGEADEVAEPEDKMEALRVLTEQIAPGQWDAARQPSEDELRQTAVWAVPLDRASAKVRSGPPEDEDADYALPVWAGVLPLTTVPGAVVADPRLRPGLEPPRHVTGWRLP